MAELTNSERAKLRNALVAALPNTEMQMFIDEYFGEKFSHIAPPDSESDYAFRVFRLIEYFRMQDGLPDLVAAARERRPKSAGIAAIAEKLGLTITGPRFDMPPGEQAQPFEKIVQLKAEFINPTVLSTRMAALEGQVCWIAIPGGGGGTGFLVGPDLVLTNHHVMTKVAGNPALAKGVVLRFDFKQTLDGQPVLRKKITECCLAAGAWCVDSKLPSGKDWDPALGDADLDELDYALLRLDQPIGEDPVGGATADSTAAPRGWIDASTIGVAPDVGQHVFVLQHPEGDPLRLSVGTITEYNGNRSRVRYNANSKDGSSGSPCFNAQLQLFALHHAHDTQTPPRWNQAVPMAAIVDRWKYPKG